MSMRLPACIFWIAAWCAAFAFGQECRLTPLTPVVPALTVEDGERALESQTFLTTVSAVSRESQLHFVDSVNRIRRLDPSGQLFTVAGSGMRGVDLADGPATETALPAVGQILFSPAGVLHFVSVGRVWKVEGGRIIAVAGTGRPGFNGEARPALELNLGGIVNAAFTPGGSLLIVDAFNRLRRLDPDGQLSTIAGTTRLAATNGLTGDGGPSHEASLSNPSR